MEQMEIGQKDDEARGPSQKVPYPKGVFFIMATELSERFSYYGMRAVLTIYMRNVLTFSEDTATSYYHLFLMICYGLPIVWGVISDSWLGKYNTIFYVSGLFAIGNIVLTLSSIPPLHIPTRGFFFIGLFLMAIGTAGMKPCVAPLGGEQFHPSQVTQLKFFFSIFFFAVTIGNMVSTIITPIFRRDVECFGMENCYPLAFGVPAAVMILAIVIFVSGKRLYKIEQPKGNMLVKVTKCVAHALTNRKRKSRSLEKKSHWLDNASELYDEHVIQDTKLLFRVLPYFLPVPMFFALYEQLGSRWTLQATRMNGRIGNTGFSIKPDQMQTSNAILMFVSLPLFNFVVYPIIAKFGFNFRTLQRMVVGGLLASMSFAVAGIVELKIEPSIKLKPADGNTVLTVSNGAHCAVTLSTNPSTAFAEIYALNPESYITLPAQRFYNPVPILVKTEAENCLARNGSQFIGEWTGTMSPIQGAYQSLSIFEAEDGSLSVDIMPFEDDYAKSKDGNARARFIILHDPSATHFENVSETKIILTRTHGGLPQSVEFSQKDHLYYSDTEEIEEDSYDVTLQTPKGSITLTSNETVNLMNGGSYNFLVYNNGLDKGQVKWQLTTITPENNIHILWLLPQYVLMAWGEILFIVSGMEFAYTEAPPSMKSVVQGIWHLMNAFGNIIVIVSAQNHGTSTQAVEFFVFSGLMLLDSIIYGIMALRYKYLGVQSGDAVFH